MARHPARDDPRPGGPAGHGTADRRLHRVRSVGRFAARRAPHPDLRAAPPAAARRPTGRAGRRRDGDDRRPVGALGGTEPARPRRRSRATSRRSAAQLERFLDFTPGASAARHGRTTSTGSASCRCIDFLRDIGKHFTIPYMLAKDSVQARLERGLSFTEFSYMLLQAYDFAHLHRTHGRRAADGRRRPVGQHHGRPGAHPPDRAGVDEAADEQPAHGLAYKLLLSPSGTKFGKSGGRRVGLAGRRRGRRRIAFYQYWLNTDDRDVGTYLRWFTELPRERDRGARRGGRGPARGARGPAGPRARYHRRGRTARLRRPRAARDADAMFSTDPVQDPAVLALAARVHRRFRVRPWLALTAGAAVTPGGHGRARLPW